MQNDHHPKGFAVSRPYRKDGPPCEKGIPTALSVVWWEVRHEGDRRERPRKMRLVTVGVMFGATPAGWDLAKALADHKNASDPDEPAWIEEHY